MTYKNLKVFEWYNMGPVKDDFQNWLVACWDNLHNGMFIYWGVGEHVAEALDSDDVGYDEAVRIDTWLKSQGVAEYEEVVINFNW